jgi:predicted metalloendopeptidase
LGGVGTFGVVACVQEVAVTPGELLADADLIHYTLGASEKDEEEAIRKAVDFSTTARRQTVNWSGLPCEARFWDLQVSVLTIDTKSPARLCMHKRKRVSSGQKGFDLKARQCMFPP